MFAVLTEKKSSWQTDQIDQYWELTEDPVKAAEAKDVVFDIFDYEGLMAVVAERHPTPVGCTFAESCGNARIQVRSTPITKDGATDEEIFAAARELGSVQVYHNSEFNNKHRSPRAVALGDFVYIGTMLTYNPKKAKSVLKAQGTKGNKALMNGDPHIDLLKGVRDSLWRMVKEHFTMKYWYMHGALRASTNSKSDMCQAIMVNIRVLKMMYHGRPEWRKVQNFDNQGPQTEPMDAIEALIPYAAGLRKRGESKDKVFVERRQWNRELCRDEKVMVDVTIENRWFKRVALFLEKEARFLADNPRA